MNEVVRDMLSLGSISVADLTEARVHIQDLVVRLACERASDDDLDALAGQHRPHPAHDGRRRPTSPASNASREFYRLLAAARRTTRCSTWWFESVTEVLMQFVYARVAAGGKPQPRLVEKRRAFLAALRARDPAEATRLMRVHLESVHRLLGGDGTRPGAPGPRAA